MKRSKTLAEQRLGSVDEFEGFTLVQRLGAVSVPLGLDDHEPVGLLIDRDGVDAVVIESVDDAGRRLRRAKARDHLNGQRRQASRQQHAVRNGQGFPVRQVQVGDDIAADRGLDLSDVQNAHRPP